MLLLLCSNSAWSQLSPGDLTNAHAHLEGMGNCTQCHDIGQKVPNQKCLDCHNEIDNLIQADRGFHASDDVIGMECVDCHSEHHGKKFEMIRFDQENFDHTLTGFLLEGQHAVIDCKECHKPDNINDAEIKKREGTFLGLEIACLDCHDDFHQQTLGNDCLQCHNYDSFRPASGFDHADADFNLRGAHKSVDCKECHPITTRNGEEYQQFTDIAFAKCTDCHDDPHNGQLATSCTQCHTEESFTNFIGKGRFNHNTTNFELRGSHNSVDCFSCHNNSTTPATVFQDLLDIPESSCIECHDDVHEGKFGIDCQRCHTEESFYALKDMSMFDHSVTDYPLEGLHMDVDCNACHTEKYTEAIDFAECKNCHEDYHEGEFTSSRESADCKDCHTLDQQFTYTSYGHDEHNVSQFPLEGAHIATPCFDCHLDEDHWTFKNIGQSCIDCHHDIHSGIIDPGYYPENDCTSCHTSEYWADISFDHSLTDWPLTGAHTSIGCRDCHFNEEEGKNEIIQQFSELNSECIQCHENVHGDQFQMDDVTNCVRCHNTQSWLPNNFDHSTTAFPLDGKHVEVDCYECHTNTAEVDGRSIVIFKIEKHECIDCHM